MQDTWYVTLVKGLFKPKVVLTQKLRTTALENPNYMTATNYILTHKMKKKSLIKHSL